MYNDLNETSPRIKQPNKMKDTLQIHQLSCIAAMKKMEKDGQIECDSEEHIAYVKKMITTTLPTRAQYELKHIIMNTNTAILADKVGSGKTHIIYGLLSSCTRPKPKDYILCGLNHLSIRVLDDVNPVKTSLIVLPHNIVDQWTNLGKRTKLSIMTFSVETDFDIFFDIDEIPTGHPDTKLPASFYNKFTDYGTEKVIVHRFRGKYTRKILNMERVNKTLETTRIFLLNINRYTTFSKIFHNIKWSRLIIDEIVSIGIPRNFIEFGSFNWFITATPKSVMGGSSYRYLWSLYGERASMIPLFIVKNNDEFVEKSQSLPDPYVFIIVTKLQAGINAIKDLIPTDILTMINAGNMQGAIKKLNCDVDTGDNIFEVLTSTLNTTLHNKKKELEYTKGVIITNEKNKQDHEAKIQKLIQTIKTLKYKVNQVKDRINSIREECCFICADSFKNPTIVECCNNIFCLNCLMMALNKSSNKCPYCRTVIKSKMYHIISDDVEAKKPQKKNDNETHVDKQFITYEKAYVLEILLKHIAKIEKTPRIMIFSDFIKTFDNLVNIFANINLQYDRLSGTPSHISKTIERYNAGEINIIMTESKNYGSGLNLQSTDYLILYHRMSEDLETQVIGRAQRFGREKKLRVFYLVDNNENLTTFSNKTINLKNIDMLKYINNPDEYVEEELISDDESSSIEDTESSDIPSDESSNDSSTLESTEESSSIDILGSISEYSDIDIENMSDDEIIKNLIDPDELPKKHKNLSKKSSTKSDKKNSKSSKKIINRPKNLVNHLKKNSK